MIKENIRLRKVIVHIMDSTVGMPVLSDTELEYGSEIAEFLKEHIAKISSGDDAKECRFYKEESEVYQMLNAYADEDFVTVSKDIASMLYEIMNSNIDIPPGYRTGQAYIFVQNDGDSMISIMSGANEALTSQDIQESERIFENTAFCLVQTEIPMETVMEACRIARKYGARTILKPVACGVLPEQLLKNVDIIVPNAEEINAICPFEVDMDKQAQYLLEQGIDTVIVTLGADGCFVKTRKEAQYFPAVPFDVIDASGAADAFISALATYLLNGYELYEAVRIASYAAGFSISRQGVAPSLIDKNSLEAYIMQREPGILQTTK